MGSRQLMRLATLSCTGSTILDIGAVGALHTCPSLPLGGEVQAHGRVLCLCDCVPGYVLTAMWPLCRLANSSLSKCLEIYLHSCGPHLEVDARNKAGLTAAEVAAASGNDVCLDLVRRYKSHALFAQPPAPSPGQVWQLPSSCAWGQAFRQPCMLQPSSPPCSCPVVGHWTMLWGQLKTLAGAGTAAAACRGPLSRLLLRPRHGGCLEGHGPRVQHAAAARAGPGGGGQPGAVPELHRAGDLGHPAARLARRAPQVL